MDSLPPLDHAKVRAIFQRIFDADSKGTVPASDAKYILNILIDVTEAGAKLVVRDIANRSIMDAMDGRLKN